MDSSYMDIKESISYEFNDLPKVSWYYFGGKFESVVFKDTMVACEIYTSLVMFSRSWYRGNMMIPWLWWYHGCIGLLNYFEFEWIL